MCSDTSSHNIIYKKNYTHLNNISHYVILLEHNFRHPFPYFMVILSNNGSEKFLFKIFSVWQGYPLLKINVNF